MPEDLKEIIQWVIAFPIAAVVLWIGEGIARHW